MLFALALSALAGFAWQPAAVGGPPARHRAHVSLAEKLSPLEECMLSLPLDAVPECVRLLSEEDRPGDGAAHIEAATAAKGSTRTALSLCLGEAKNDGDVEECVLANDSEDEHSYG